MAQACWAAEFSSHIEMSAEASLAQCRTRSHENEKARHQCGFVSRRRLALRGVARGTTAHRRDQSAGPQRRASLGTVVRELPVGIEKRRLAENGESEPGRGVLFRLGLEQW